MSSPSIEVANGAITFWMRVRPRAARERVGIASSGELRLDVHAAPEEGEANEACRRLLARAAGVPVRAVSIVTGARSRRKRVRIECPNPQQIRQRLLEVAQAYSGRFADC